ncbi:MAG: hypothetical protein WCO96_01150 [Actinomycetes bacterium]
MKLIELGSTQDEANSTVGVSSATVRRWLQEGRAGKSDERRKFAETFDALPKRKPRPAPKSLVKQEREGKLTPDQLEALLEQAAVDLNVQAIRLLLERPWEKNADENESPRVTLADELAAFRERKAGTG